MKRYISLITSLALLLGLLSGIGGERVDASTNLGDSDYLINEFILDKSKVTVEEPMDTKTHTLPYVLANNIKGTSRLVDGLYHSVKPSGQSNFTVNFVEFETGEVTTLSEFAGDNTLPVISLDGEVLYYLNTQGTAKTIYKYQNGINESVVTIGATSQIGDLATNKDGTAIYWTEFIALGSKGSIKKLVNGNIETVYEGKSLITKLFYTGHNDLILYDTTSDISKNTLLKLDLDTKSVSDTKVSGLSNLNSFSMESGRFTTGNRVISTNMLTDTSLSQYGLPSTAYLSSDGNSVATSMDGSNSYSVDLITGKRTTLLGVPASITLFNGNGTYITISGTNLGVHRENETPINFEYDFTEYSVGSFPWIEGFDSRSMTVSRWNGPQGGSKIAFYTPEETRTGWYYVNVFDFETYTTERTVSNYGTGPVMISENGKILLATSSTGTYTYVYDLENSKRLKAISPASCNAGTNAKVGVPSISSDGRTVVFGVLDFTTAYLCSYDTSTEVGKRITSFSASNTGSVPGVFKVSANGTKFMVNYSESWSNGTTYEYRLLMDTLTNSHKTLPASPDIFGEVSRSGKLFRPASTSQADKVYNTSDLKVAAEGTARVLDTTENFILYFDSELNGQYILDKRTGIATRMAGSWTNPYYLKDSAFIEEVPYFFRNGDAKFTFTRSELLNPPEEILPSEGSSNEIIVESPKNLTVTKINDNSVEITWDIETDITYTLTMGSEILYKGGEGSFLYEGIEYDKDYEFNLMPEKDGVAGPFATTTYRIDSPEVIPEKPLGLNAEYLGNGEVKVTWQKVEGVSYTLKLDEMENTTQLGEVGTHTLTGMEEGRTYTITLTPVQGSKEGPSSSLTYTVPTIPLTDEVSNLIVTVNTPFQTIFTWDLEDGADKYLIMEGSEVISEVSGDVGTYTYRSPGTGNHEITLKVVKGDKVSEGVSVKYVTPDPLKVESLISTYVDSKRVEFLWEGVPGSTGYNFYHNGVLVESNIQENSYTHLTPIVGTTNSYKVEALYLEDVTEGKDLMVYVPEEFPNLEGIINFRVESPNPTVLKLSWDSVTDANIYEVSEYNKVLYTGPELEFYITDTNTTINRTFHIRAVHGGEYSNPVVSTYTPEVIEVEDVLYFASLYKDDTFITLEWDSVLGAQGYKLYKNGVLYRNFINITTQFTDREVVPEDTITYTLRVVKDGNISEGKTVLVEVPEKKLEMTLAEKDSVVVRATEDGNIEISWDDMPWADRFDIIDDVSLKAESETSPIVLTGYDLEELHYFKFVPVVVGKQVSHHQIEYIPEEVVPNKLEGTTVVRTYSDGAVIKWNRTRGAEVYRVELIDGTILFEGNATQYRDSTALPETEVTYIIYPVNRNGDGLPGTVTVTTSPETIKVELVAPPTPPIEGEVVITFKVVDGVDAYYAERNPGWVFTRNPDGTFGKTYSNSATGSSINFGNVTPVNGSLGFTDSEVIPGENYKYNIVGVRLGTNGEEQVIVDGDVDITTPVDGSGVSPIPTTPTIPTNPNPPITGGGGGYFPPTVTPVEDGGKEVEDKEEITLLGKVASCYEDNKVTLTDINFHWAKSVIGDLANKGVVKGYANGEFKPNNELTRAEFVALLIRALCLDTVDYNTKFTDIKDGTWYYDYILTAQHYGLVEGTSETTFTPSRNISRQEISTILGRLMEISGLLDKDMDVDKLLGAYSDYKDVAGYAKMYVAGTVNEGIIKGDKGKLKPRDNTTRAEIATIMYRFIEFVK